MAAAAMAGFPRIAELATSVSHDGILGACDDDVEFAIGLDLILDGLERLRASRVSAPSRELVVTDAPERERYEAHLDGELAGILEYVAKRSRIALIHTEVLPEFEGQGIGSALVRYALDDARRRELRVIATCPYVQSYVARHPEDDDIVVGRGQPAAS